MRRLSYDRLIFRSLLVLLACFGSPLFGEDNAGPSTWKIVSASESSDDLAVPQASSSVWEESFSPLSAPPEQRAAQPPLPLSAQPMPTQPAPQPVLQTAPTQSALPPTVQAAPAQPAPQPMHRALIPSRQLAAANRGEMLSGPVSNEQVRSAIGYNGRTASSQTVVQMPRRTPIVPSPRPAHRRGKPFQTTTRDPTINPWLNLDRSEDYVDLPNYFTFVRPQLDQMETNRRSRADLLHLQREVQTVSTAVVGAQRGSAGLPPTGHTARFMDTAQFYGRWNR